MNDGVVKNVSGEEIPRIQYHLVNEFEELSVSSSDKRKRLRGTPDPDAKVIALFPKELQNSRNFVCDVCALRFTHKQNLQFHLRKHSIYYKLPKKEVVGLTRKKVYTCPDSSCIHHNATRALSSITAIKKHYQRKHKEKSLRCVKCLREYALQIDLDAHIKKCSIKKPECSRCGFNYSRIDEFEIHKYECQLQGSMSNEFMHMSSTMSEENLQVPKLPINFGPSSTSFMDYIDQSLKKYDEFEMTEFILPEPFQPIVQMSDSSQQHSFHANSYPKNLFGNQPTGICFDRIYDGNPLF